MLTDPDCRNATCPDGQQRRRLTGRTGPYLALSPCGSKRCLRKFYPDGKASRLALGSDPEVTLNAAQAAPDDARKTCQSGPSSVQTCL